MTCIFGSLLRSSSLLWLLYHESVFAPSMFNDHFTIHYSDIPGRQSSWLVPVQALRLLCSQKNSFLSHFLQPPKASQWWALWSNGLAHSTNACSVSQSRHLTQFISAACGAEEWSHLQRPSSRMRHFHERHSSRGLPNFGGRRAILENEGDVY